MRSEVHVYKGYDRSVSGQRYMYIRVMTGLCEVRGTCI